MSRPICFLWFVIVLLVSCSDAPQPSPNAIVQHGEMEELLRKMYEAEDPEINFSRNDLAVERLKAEVANGNTDVMFELGLQLLLSGEEDEAISIISEQIRTYFGSDTTVASIEAAQAMHWLALAYFRKGEVDNCRENHNASSCILPLNAEGQHKHPEGSLNALKLYGKILEHNPDDVLARWMFNLAAMTLGRHPENVPQKWRVDFERYNDHAAPFTTFTDVATNLGMTQKGYFGGSIIADFNNDGLLDLFSTDNPLNEEIKLWLRKADGSFEYATKTAGLEGITGGVNAIQTDYNNDGWIDIFIVRGGWLTLGGNQPASLLRNNGDGTFTDVTIEAGLLNHSPSHSAIWADLDNDGFLDLIVGHETGLYEQIENPNEPIEVPINKTKVYQNNGDGTFKDVTENCGLDVAVWVKGVVTLDYDLDGKQDIYLSVYNGDNRLFKNVSSTKQIRFEDVSEKAGITDPKFCFPAVSVDFNNDGWPDIFVAGYATEQDQLPSEYTANIPPLYPSYTYINQKNGTFVAEEGFKLPYSIMAMALNVGDFDNDGFIDLYLGTGAGALSSLFPNVMLKNVDGKRWANVTSTARVGHLQKTHGISVADLDRDGDLDMYVELGGLLDGDFFWNALYENKLAEKGKWINILLEGTQSNRPAIGARIEVEYTQNGQTKTITRTVDSGGSYGASPWEQHIAMSSADKILNIKVTWPNGLVEQTGELAFNKHYHWLEGNKTPTPRTVKTLPFSENNPSAPGEKEHHHHH